MVFCSRSSLQKFIKDSIPYNASDFKSLKWSWKLFYIIFDSQSHLHFIFPKCNEHYRSMLWWWEKQNNDGLRSCRMKRVASGLFSRPPSSCTYPGVRVRNLILSRSYFLLPTLRLFRANSWSYWLEFRRWDILDTSHTINGRRSLFCKQKLKKKIQRERN